jgi:hypothetical protein
MKHTLLSALFVILCALPASAQTNTFPASGSVGIGTTSPGAILDVEGSGGVLLNAGNLSVGVASPFTWNSSNYVLALGTNSSFVDFNGGGTGIYKNFYQDTGGTGRYMANGISTQMLLRASGNISFLTASSGTAGAAVTYTERMTILNSGNVGIGSTSPSSPLTVNGTIQSTTGGVKFPDGTTQTTAATSGLWDMGKKLATVDAAGLSSASFGSTYITNAYNCYKVIADGILPATNGAKFILQVSPDNGTTIEGSGYQWAAAGGDTGGAYYGNSSSDSAIQLTAGRGVYNTAGLTDQIEVTFCNPSSSNITTFRWSIANFDQSSGANLLQTLNGAGAWSTAGALNYITFSFSSGNFTSGKLHLYGLNGT